MKSLFGYGLTTKAIAKSGGWHIFDDKFKESSFDKYGNKLLPSNEFNPEKSSLEITSPGIPPSHPLIKKAKNLISEFDYFYDKAPFQIWITGTNGKTTTTQMVYHLLKDHGADIGGNIGIPLADMKKDANFWVVEASSFQLHYTKYAKPNIFIILPLKEDHTSWHGSFEEYVKAKLSPLKRMTERDVVIMPKNLNTGTKAFKILYENEKELIEYFDFKHTFSEVPFLLDELMAKAVYKILFLKEKNLKNFKIDPHKLEEFKDSQGRVWVDDSKATNVDAALNALTRYKNKKIFMIIGGDDKGQDFTPLFKYMKNLDIKLFIIGNKPELFADLAEQYNINYEISNEMEKAVKSIKKVHTDKSVALLSPACASFDQFNGYKERGKRFKKFVMELQ
ncbi:UDP-N-acetylmuramoylalanine--D-glutamate ligase [Nautilia profundicola AmH]|uniref:UDP-N-acetylmuramoylalanine--D-glutamate ligase n=1 Tax=Nautilia profundicola (strain ATCC BAA-1463 / DSM 18972 / AmH) TaxID=598659 RepID=B9L7V4_NAUPA|nr:UDP-N-acetylmuramoyl-L-alanine--D-glutamate ligase [Nautilia profundicola]ACM92642.1 UDP-N-acetylmuramoylalanine--D-glutamate ligase [Nautilia profundicola AmH]